MKQIASFVAAIPAVVLWIACCSPPSLAEGPDKALSPTNLPQEGVRFPDDGGVLNVLDFGATRDDQTDDTAAIRITPIAGGSGRATHAESLALGEFHLRISATEHW